MAAEVWALMLAEVSAPMPAEVLASMAAPIQASAADRVSVLGIPVTSLRPARDLNTSAGTLGVPQDRHSGKAKSQEAPTSPHGTLATRLR